ncbi:O-antigen ligase family protein [Methylobacterium sp. BTF04]|uniref:O-antigen ligase family protein n=1 Tax=Methylobacterium sp. BTF04 TaxID=2708300 RepID=UPI0013D71F84|nr:O-antigen ligase family protein [Methylobacterium sp. BTF04]NEU13727.1 O-antigen ligase family protein [Methylobacterium sp. BTF04]
MAAANRSSPLVVGLAALLFLSAGLIEDARATRIALLAPLRTPLGLAALAFLAWCGLSFVWSPFPALSLRTAAEFLPALISAYCLARLAPGRMPAWAPALAGGLLGAACLYIVVDLAADLPVQKALGARVAYFIFNRPLLTILLVAGPLAAVLYQRGKRVAGLAVLALGAVAILRSISGAAAMGLMAGAAMAAIVRLLPRRFGLGLAGTGLMLALVLAPVEGDLLDRLMPEAVHDRLVQSSSRARVAIARSFGAAVAADPWRGAGYGISAKFAQTPVAARIEPEFRTLLAVGHPHNSFLQVWAELGFIGAALAGAALLLMLQRLALLARPQMTTALGLVAAAAAVAFVEHGAWQGWWVAGLGAAIAWLREVDASA